MKTLVSVALLALAASVYVPAQQSSQSESLGDVARQQRAADKSAPKQKVWTNDDFPDAATAPAPAASETSGTGDTAKPTEPAKSGDEAATASVKDADKEKAKKPDPVADQEKLNTEWKGKLDAQKAKIADLQREYDLTDREYKLSVTSYYADAGNRLRDQKDFTDKETSYRKKLDNLKQQISDEQAKLSDLQDQAHKAGANKAYE